MDKRVLVDDLTVEQLLELYNVVRNKRKLPILETWNGTRARLIVRIEKYEKIRWKATHQMQEIKRKQKAAYKQRVQYLGVGKFVKSLLMEIIGKDDEGHDVGHSYAEILRRTKAEFPNSKVDQKHVVWYRYKMQELGLKAPVYRERSSWLKT